MSAHAIHARRDLADLFVLFLELLEPLFLFLLDGRRVVKLPAVPTDGSGGKVPNGVTAPAVLDPLPAVWVASDTSSDTTTEGTEKPLENAGEPPEASGSVWRRVGGSPAATEATGCGMSAPGGRFVKVAGRFRPAPDGFDGVAFVRVRSAGGRVTYRPVAA